MTQNNAVPRLLFSLLISTLYVLISQFPSQAAVVGDAYLFYGSVAGGSTPEMYRYDSNTSSWFCNDSTVATAGTIYFVRGKQSPLSSEIILGVKNQWNGLFVMRYENGVWVNDWNTTLAYNRQDYDIVYEQVSGDAMVLNSQNGNDQPFYSIWNGSSWTANQAVTTGIVSGGEVVWIEAAERPGTDEIAVVYAIDNGGAERVGVSVWNGNAWSCTSGQIEANLEVDSIQYRQIEIEYEQSSGDLLVVWAPTSTDMYARRKAAGTCTFTNANLNTSDEATNMSIAARPGTDEILVPSIDTGSNDLQYSYWNGGGWTHRNNADGGCDAESGVRQMTAAAWASNRGVIIYADNGGTDVDWALYNGGWSGVQNWTPTPTLTNEEAAMLGRTLDNNTAMFIIEDKSNDLWAKTYDNTGTWSNTEGGSALETDVSTNVRRPFELVPIRVAFPTLSVSATSGQPPAAPQGAANVLMGMFTFSVDTGNTNVTDIVISEAGTINASANLANVEIWTDTDGVWDGNEAQFGATAAFNGASNASFNDSVNVAAATPVYFYVILDIGVGAGVGDTLEIEITDTTDVATDSGDKYCSFPALLANTTTITGADFVAPELTAISTGPADGECSGRSDVTYTFDITEAGGLALNSLVLHYEFYSGAPTGVEDGVVNLSIGGVAPNLTGTADVPFGTALGTDTDALLWITGSDIAGNAVTSSIVPTYLLGGKGSQKIAMEIVISNAAALASSGGEAGAAIAVNIESQDDTGATCTKDNYTWLTFVTDQAVTGSFWQDSGMATQITTGNQIQLANGVSTVYYMDTDEVDPDPQITVSDTAGVLDNSPDADNETVRISKTMNNDYDFGTCTYGADCWIWAYDSDVFPYAGNTANRNAGEVPTAGELTAISASNDSRWMTNDPNNGDEQFLWVEMQISETPETVRAIEFYYEGYPQTGTYNHTMWVMQDGAAWQDTASWTQLGGTTSIPTGSDGVIQETLSTSVASYINAGTGLVTWGVYQNANSQRMYLDYVRMRVFQYNAIVDTVDTQTSQMIIPSTDNYIGAKFSIAELGDYHNVTSITITENGTVDAQNDLSNVRLFYESDTSNPYDCSGETYDGTEAQFGAATTFNAVDGVAVFNDSAGITLTSTLCVYVVLDVDATANDGDTVEIEVNDPTTEVTIDGSGYVGPDAVVQLAGTTTLNFNCDLTVSSINTQVPSMAISSANNAVGATLVFTEGTGQCGISGVTIAEQGTVNAQTNIANIDLYYEMDTTAPYDCVGETYAGTETQFGVTAASFNAANGTASYTDAVTISTTSTMCMYAVLDVGTAASGETLEIQINDASTDVTVGAGAVAPGAAVLMPGTTRLTYTCDLTVSTNGNQTATIGLPSSGSYVGGSFVLLENTDKCEIQDITVTEQGTVDANANLSNVKLFYEFDTSGPFNCASETYDGTETQFGGTTTFDAANGVATFSGNVLTNNTRAVCVYMVFDVGAGASDGQTVEVQITDPSTEVGVGAGVVAPGVAQAIAGTSTLRYACDLTVSTNGGQTSSMGITSTDNYLGGTFIFQENSTYCTVTDIDISEAGSVNAQTGLSNIKLYYEFDTTPPYNCAGESYAGTEAQFGATTNFNAANGIASFNDSVLLSTVKTMCVYAVMDVTDGANDSELLDVEITDPSTDITVAMGSVGPTTPVQILNSTELQVTCDLTVSTLNNQTATMAIPSADNYLGGTFVFTENSFRCRITDIDIAENGTTDGQDNLQNIKLFYELDSSAPYNCASESYNGTETQFGAATFFDSANGTASFSDSVSVDTTNTMCLYAVMSVMTTAASGETVEIEITDPSTDVGVGKGVVAPGTTEAMAGTTVLDYVCDMTVSTTGTQVVSVGLPSVDNYIGGTLVFTENTNACKINSVTIAEQGSVNAQTGLSNIKLFYEKDTSAPYNCASETYDGTEAQYGIKSTFDAANGQSTFTGNVIAFATQTVCMYPMLGVVEVAANDGETIEIEITDPSADVTVSSGVIGPGTTEAIAGTTTINYSVCDLTVSTRGTQIPNMGIPSQDNELGAMFVLTDGTQGCYINGITISEQGTADATSEIFNISMYYENDTTSPYDCVSEGYAGTETQLGATTVFDAADGVATFNGIVGATPKSALCLYTVLDVDPTATDGSTVEIQIDDPSSDISVAAGAVLPAVAVAEPGTTTLVDAALLPTINNINPNPLVSGEAITISGWNFGAVQGASKVYFGSKEATVISNWTDSVIVANAPANVTDGSVYVQTAYSSNAIAYSVRPPVIASLSPASGYFYQTISILGSDFGYVQGSSYVKFSPGVNPQIVSWGNDEIQVKVPLGTIDGPVSVTTTGGLSNEDVIFTLSADTSTWPFTYPVNYDYATSSIIVQGGNAELLPVNNPEWKHWTWPKRRPLIIDNTGYAGADLTNYVVKITLTDGNFDWTDVNADGGNLRFTTADSTSDLPYYYDTASFGSPSTDIYVKIPLLKAATETTVFMYYGHDTASYAGVYSNAFTKVGEAGYLNDYKDAANPDLWRVNQDPYRVNYSSTFATIPVAFGYMASEDGGDRSHTRVSNTTTSSFELRIEESVGHDNTHTEEDGMWMSFMPGTWMIGGVRVDVWREGNLSNPFDGGIDETYTTVNYPGGAFSAVPSVVAFIQSNQSIYPTPVSARIRSRNNTSFVVFSELSDDGAPNPPPADVLPESIGFIAMEQAETDSTLQGSTGIAGVLQENDVYTWHNYGLSIGSFAAQPAVAAVVCSENEEDATHVRWARQVQTSQMNVQIEDALQCVDAHVNEDVCWIAYQTGPIYGRPIINPEPTIDYGQPEQTPIYPATTPAIRPIDDEGVAFGQVTAFTENIGVGNQGEVKYQVSNNGADWYWFNGANWVSSDMSWTQANYATSEVAPNINTFHSDVGAGTFYFRALLFSTGAAFTQLDGVYIDYQAPPNPPTISNAPGTLVAGETVTITGTDFGNAQDTSHVYFGSIDAGAASSWNDNSITITAPEYVADGKIKVIASNFMSNLVSYTVRTPSITLLMPNTGYYGDEITVMGNDFGYLQGNSYVTFTTGEVAEIVSWDNTSILVRVPPGCINGNVTVTTAGGTSNGVAFTLSPDNSTWPFTYPGKYVASSTIDLVNDFAQLASTNSPPWWDTAYSYRQKIEIDNSAGGELTDFPLVVELNSANFDFSKALSDGGDLRFVATDSVTTYSYYYNYYENYDSIGESAKIYVEIPRIRGGAVEEFYMYFGNTRVSYQNMYTSVFRLIGESGLTTGVDENQDTINFAYGPYTLPTVFALANTNNNGDSDHTRVITDRAGGVSFNIYVEESEDNNGNANNEDVGWFAMEEGNWMVGEMLMMVWSENLSSGFAGKTYPGGYNFAVDPVVLGMAQTANFNWNNNEPNHIRIRNRGTGGYEIQLEECDNTQDGIPGNELVAMVAAERGETASSTLDMVIKTGWWDSSNTCLSIAGAFPNAVKVVVPQLVTEGYGAAADIGKSAHINVDLYDDWNFDDWCDFTVRVENARNVSGHSAEVYDFFGLQPNAPIYARPWVDPFPSTSVDNTLQTPIFATTKPYVTPTATNGRAFDEITNFSYVEGYQNAGSFKFQVTNDNSFSNWYWWDGGMWATATLGVTEANDAADIDDNVVTFDDKYGTGEFFFRAYLISGAGEFAQLDGVNIVRRSENQAHYSWASHTASPAFEATDTPFIIGYHTQQKYLLAVQLAHEFATSSFVAQLQYRWANGGAYGSWKNMTTSSQEWKAVAGDWGADGDTVAPANFTVNGADVTGTAVDGKYSEQGLVAYTFASGTAYSELWYSIQPTEDAKGYDYQFRVSKSGSDSGFRYQNYPYIGGPPTKGTINLAAGFECSGDTTPNFELYCQDPFGTDCAAGAPGDAFRLSCVDDRTVLGAYPLTNYTTAYNNTFDVTDPAWGCNVGSGNKKVYVEYSDENGYQQWTHASTTVTLDVTTPVFSAGPVVDVTSDKEPYFIGTADIVTCDPSVYPALSCETLFDNYPGQGAGQWITVSIASPTAYIEDHPTKFYSDPAFGQTPTPDESAPDFSLSFKVESKWATSQTGIQFYLEDCAGNVDVFKVDFIRDVIAPRPVSGVIGYATQGSSITLTKGGWYNYPSPYFDWPDSIDDPQPLNSGTLGYYATLTQNLGDPVTVSYATSAFNATGPITTQGTYYLRTKTEDNMHNIGFSTTSFIYRYDSVEPTLRYNSPATGSQTIWYSQEPAPNDIIDIDLQWASSSPITKLQYRVNGTPAWQTVWTGSQSADYTTDWAVDWSLLSEGINEINVRGYDEAQNIDTDMYATGAAGFAYRVDLTPPDPPATASVAGWASATKLSASFNSPATYDYPNPYFEWAAPSDNPAAANAGVGAYYIGFSTDPNYNPTYYSTQAVYTASAPLVLCETYYLSVKSVDRALPPNVASPSNVFIYTYAAGGSYNVVDNAGDDVWRNSTGTVYDFDFGAQCALMDYAQYTIWTGHAMGATAGVMVATWTTFVDLMPDAVNYTTDWGISDADFAAMPDGFNYVSVRLFDNAGGTGIYQDVFYIKKDTTPPNNPAVSGYATSGEQLALTDNVWYGYSNPYFTWATATDYPQPSGGSGLKQYDIYFGTDAAGVASYATTVPRFYSTQTLVSGWTYYLRIKSRDNLDNATSTSLAFRYRYDIDPPDNPDPAAPTFLAYATAGKKLPIVSGGSYNYNNPYFEWGAPADNPDAPLNSSGVKGYYVLFDKFSTHTPTTYVTATSFTATAAYCGMWHYLNIYTVDNTTPENATGVEPLFSYFRLGNVTINDNQADDTVWHNATGPWNSFDVDFISDCDTINYIKYTMYSASNGDTGTGTVLVSWTDLWPAPMGVNSVLADWGIPDAGWLAATEGYNFVSVRMMDNNGFETFATDVFYFKKDTGPPQILTAALTESSNYLWVSPADGKLYYGLGMAGSEEFVAVGTATDSGSGLDFASFSTAFGESPDNDTSATNWRSDTNPATSYTIQNTDAVAQSIWISVHDRAGNSTTTQLFTVQDNDLQITYATMSPTVSLTFPTFAKFNVYYPDGVSEMTLGDPKGMYATTTVGADISGFIQAYAADGTPENVYDDPADATVTDYVVNKIAYQTGATSTCGGIVPGQNAWCAEIYSDQCLSSPGPHYMGISATNLPTDNFYANISEKTIDGDLGPAKVPPVVSGDNGTFPVGSGPDYLRITPMYDGLVTEDIPITSWCFGAGCTPNCDITGTDMWCSNTGATITARPEFLKFATTNATFNKRFDYSSGIPGAAEWAWDSAQGRVVLSSANTPANSTVTVTLASGSELVCVDLIDSCDQRISNGLWADAEVRLTISQAVGSNKDITWNDATGATRFANVTEPSANDDFSAHDQLTVRGDMVNGRACVYLTADDVPSESPQTPIKVSAEYLGTPALGHSGGTDTPAFVLIRPSVGFGSGTTIVGGFASAATVFTSTPAASPTAIVISPDWSHDASRLTFISRQSDPCSTGLVADAEHTGFNLYSLELTGGTLTNCRLLTANDSAGFGPLPSSEVTYSSTNDRIVFTALYPPPVVNSRKLMWVSATGSVLTATGTQVAYPPMPDSTSQGSTQLFMADAMAGTSQIQVLDSTNFAVGNKILIGSTPFANPGLSFSSDKQVRTITMITPGFPALIQFTPALTTTVPQMGAGTFGWAKSPVSLADLGQMIVPIDSSQWSDPDWTPNDINCNANYRDALFAVREPVVAASEDKVCNTGVCVNPPLGNTSNPNIVMISGTKQNNMYKVDYTTPVSDINKITHFTSGITPMKPKMSPDCTMMAFMAWDTSAEPTVPSHVDIYMINFENTSAGFATVTLPVTSLSQKGVYKIYDFASNSIEANRPAITPNWSADSTLVSYSVDRSGQFNMTNFYNTAPNSVVNLIFEESNFDSYMEYIPDQPPSQGAVYSPQIVGQVNYNEFGLVQCRPGVNPGEDCGTSGSNYPFVQVSQLNNTDGAYLRLLKMKDEATVSDAGGILFQDGIVTAIFPPNVLASDTVFWNEDPTVGYCTAVPADGPGGGNCPLDPTNEFIATAGDAREFFPDGTNFESYVRLIFRYCDNDNDGYVDTGTEGVETAVAGGAYTFNPVTGECSIAGVKTSGGTIDVDTLAVFNWDRANAQWVRMDGVVDKTARTITVFSTHFSRYDTLGFRSYAPQVIQPLALSGIHTYPNPYVRGQHSSGIIFAADGVTGGADINIDIEIYDIRGSRVAQLMGVVPANFASVYENSSYTLLRWPDPVNGAGRQLASGVYLYYLHASDLNGFTATYKGKFSVVR